MIYFFAASIVITFVFKKRYLKINHLHYIEMKVLTFEEIESKMPVTKGILDGAYIMNLTFSKHVFGYDLIDLTPKVAQHLIGKEFICVKGQHHDDYITKS